MHASVLPPTLVAECIWAIVCAAMQPTLTSAIYLPTADCRRRAKFWSRSCLETSSRWIIQTLLWTAPSSVWWNLKTARGQNKLVVGPKQSFRARCAGVQFCPVMSDQRFIGSRRSQFLSQHLSTGKVAAETELYSVHTVFFSPRLRKERRSTIWPEAVSIPIVSEHHMCQRGGIFGFPKYAPEPGLRYPRHFHKALVARLSSNFTPFPNQAGCQKLRSQTFHAAHVSSLATLARRRWLIADWFSRHSSRVSPIKSDGWREVWWPPLPKSWARPEQESVKILIRRGGGVRE